MRALSPAQSAQATTLTRRSTTTPPRFFSSPPRHSAPHKRVPTPHDHALYPRPPPSTSSTSLSTPDPHDARASPDPRDALSTPDSRRPDVQSRLCSQLRRAAPVSQRAALVSRRAFTLLTPSESTPCAQMLRSAAVDSERPLFAESQYGSISRAPAREPRMAPSPPKKEIICTHLTGTSYSSQLTLTTSSISTEKSARQHVKARKGAHSALARTSARPRSGRTPPPRRLEHPRRVFGLRSRLRIDSHWRGVLAPCPVCWRAREERLPGPPRVARAQSLRTLRTFDWLHASPARGAASLWLAH
ncbi:hypothetical protein C8J57DRAFT_1705005 [Mycena rebaudengoi]|nr:hypothetical protein C8J57DRAFT_1705005 [Mycena rebaudengoi]